MKNMKTDEKPLRRDFNLNKRNLITSPALRRTMIAVFYVMTVLLSFLSTSGNIIEVNEGDMCPENIIAPTRMVDTIMTQALREQAADMTSPVYDYISAAQSKTTQSVESLRKIMLDVYKEYIGEDTTGEYNNICGTQLTAEDFSYLISASGETKNRFINALNRIITQIYSGEVKSTELDKVTKQAVEMLDGYSMPQKAKQIAKSVLEQILAPNMVLNENATQIAREAARQSVYEVVYDAGQTIINKGEIVTAHQIKFLKDYGLIKTELFENVSTSLGIPLLLAIFTAMLFYYIRYYHGDIYRNNKKMLVFISLFFVSLLCAKLLNSFSVYLIPAAMLTLSVSLIFKASFAVQINIFMMLFLGITLNLDLDSFIYLAVCGYIGIAYVHKIKKRADLFSSCIAVCLSNVVMLPVLLVMRNNLSAVNAVNFVYAVGGGMFSAVGASFLMMLCEQVFNMPTPFMLLEMSGANDAAMQNLIKNAPGTYYHSIIVGNLAESAASAIGVNALLTKVGAYYHDIGKTDKAMYYKENQGEITNPHDLITPDTSARIIKNHVSDGIFTAEKSKLPDEITEFIRTHHGTSELTYFKVKAQEEGYEGEEDFRYHGKLPQSRETSIVMLADSIEAACRTLENFEPESIKNLVDKITDKKIREGQLADSPLSFEQLNKVKESFVESLNSIYHSRVKYPDEQIITEETDITE